MVHAPTIKARIQFQKALKETNEHGMKLTKKNKNICVLTCIVFLSSTHGYEVRAPLNLHILKQHNSILIFISKENTKSHT